MLTNWINRLNELMEDWRYLHHQGGYKAALPQVIQEIMTLPYRHIRFRVIARTLLEPLPNLPPKIALEIRPFTADDLSFVRHTHRPSEARLCAHRLKRGHYGLVACVEGKPAGYGWGCDDTSLEKIALRLEPTDVLCTDAFTAPAFRGQGIQTTLSLARLRHFQSIGYQRALAYIAVQNAPSLAVWHKLGAIEISRIDFRRIGFWRHTQYR